MTTVSIQLPETVFSALRKNLHEFVQEMRIAAAVKWYELGEISLRKGSRNSRSHSFGIYSRFDSLSSLFSAIHEP